MLRTVVKRKLEPTGSLGELHRSAMERADTLVFGPQRCGPGLVERGVAATAQTFVSVDVPTVCPDASLIVSLDLMPPLEVLLGAPRASY